MKNKIQNTDKIKKEELEFVQLDKAPCETCKDAKNVTLENFTKDEMDFAMTIVDKMILTKDQQLFLIGLNNRVLKDNKRYGCGKCMVQVLKNLKNAYQRLYGNN
jgi:uncharacterized protein (DUF1015 family)